MKTQMRVQKILMFVSLIVAALVFVYALIFLTGGLGDVYRYIDKDDGDLINCKNFVNTSQSFVSTLVALGIVLIVLVALMFLMACHTRRKYYVTNYVAIGLFVAFALVVAFYLVIMVANLMDLYKNNIYWESGTGHTISRTIIEYERDEDGNLIYYKVDENGEFEYRYYRIDENGNEVESVKDNPNALSEKIIDETNGSFGLPFEIDYLFRDVPANYADQSEYMSDYPLDPDQTYNFVLGFVMFVVVLADAACVVLCTLWKYKLMKGEDKLLAQGAAADGTPEQAAAATEAVETAEQVEVNTASADSPVKEE